jgi:hypothetical protein
MTTKTEQSIMSLNTQKNWFMTEPISAVWRRDEKAQHKHFSLDVDFKLPASRLVYALDVFMDVSQTEN